MNTNELLNEIIAADNGSPRMMRILNAVSVLADAYEEASESEKALIDAEVSKNWDGYPRDEKAFIEFAREARNMVYAGEMPDWAE